MRRLREHSLRDGLEQQADIHEPDDARGVERFVLTRELPAVALHGADDVVDG